MKRFLIPLVLLLGLNFVFSQNISWLENDLFSANQLYNQTLKNVQSTSHLLSGDVLPQGEGGWIELTNFSNLHSFDSNGNAVSSSLDLQAFSNLRLTLTKVDEYDATNVLNNGYQFSISKKTTLPEFYLKAYDHGTQLGSGLYPYGIFTLQMDDKIKIEKSGNIVYFRYNGVVIDQVAVNSQDKYRVAISTTTSSLQFTYSYSNFVLNSSSYVCLETNDDKNWISNCSYDITGTLISSNVNYFDKLGKSIQSQSLDLKTGKIWASETRYDNQGRPVFQTLSAPIGDAWANSLEHVYNSQFIKKNDGTLYTNLDFETNPLEPEPVGNQEYSLGNYYSSLNGDEPYQDITSYPFTRTVYDELNPGKVLKIVGGNKINTVGITEEWINGFSHSMPAGQEMYYVYGLHNFNILNGGNSNVLNYKVSKYVAIDAHDDEVVIFTDMEGKTLATAKSGGDQEYEVISVIGEQGFVDVHIPKGIDNNDIEFLTSDSYIIYDLRTSQTVSQGDMTGGNIYRIESDYQEGDVTLSNFTLSSNAKGIKYKVNYYNYALNYYNDAGHLIKTIQPLGFDELCLTSLQSQPNHNMSSFFEYNTLGQLLNTSSPDEGEANFIYRPDGQIRYSQNAKQITNGEFSYTTYDDKARPIESGVYYGPLEFSAALPFELVNPTENIVKLGNNSIKKVGNAWQGGLATIQEIVTQGGVSYTVPNNETSLMVGLSTDNSSQSYNTIDYGLYTYEDGTVRIYKLGTALPNSSGSDVHTTFNSGDSFKVQRNLSDKIEFLKNNQVFYTTSETVTGNLIGDLSFKSGEAYITDFEIFGDLITPSSIPQYINLNNVVVNGSTISKSGATDTWSHGVSTQQKINGNGSVSWTANQNNKSLMVGLATDVEVDSYGTFNNFTIYQKDNGNLLIYEDGKNLGVFDTYNSGDNFEIERVGNLVYYKKNDVIFYTSSRESNNEQLMARVSMYSQNSQISNFNLDGGILKFKDYIGTRAFHFISNGKSTITHHGIHSWNADISSNVGLNGAGYLQFSIPQNNKNSIIGFSEINTNANYNTINYALQLDQRGFIFARENGIDLGYLGNYLSNDIFKIERDVNGVIRFFRNNQEIYVSQVTTNQPSINPLYLDMSISSPQANVNNIEIIQTDTQVVDLEENFPENYCKEQHFTFYDIEDSMGRDNALAPYDLAGYYRRQNFVAGNVSKTYTRNPETTATWYSYDIYGRVEWMVQNIPGLGPKTIDYRYDDVTGQVTNVYYQKYVPNEMFIHRYNYNDVSQLVSVDVSTDNENFKEKAEYTYYETGALKRVELAEGEQGIDYVYNLAGALKSINHPELDATKDPGGDYNDVFGMIIDYHNNDYKRGVTYLNNTVDEGHDRYDGNIKAIRWANSNILNGEESAYIYNYNDNKWLTDATFGTVINNHFNESKRYQVSELTYDSNGNLLTLHRNNADEADMDNFTYNYNTNKNQLNYVKDSVEASNETNDLNDQNPNNYTYNSIGQLTNNAEGNVKYVYNASGLVTYVAVEGAEIFFNYNDNGHRVSKLVITKADKEITFYVRDASGAPMGIYYGSDSAHTFDEPRLIEVPIYGASRIGIYKHQKYFYELTDHLGNVRAVFHETGSSGSNIIYSEDFNDTTSTSPWVVSNPTTSNISINNNKLQCDITTNGGGTEMHFNVIAGKTYHVQATAFNSHIDGDLSVYVKGNNNGYLFSQTDISQGQLGFTFTALFTESVFLMYEMINIPQVTLFWIDDVAITDITNASTEIIAHTDYYPFGMPMPNRNIEGDYRYKFQGQEKDPETGMEAFELRLWDSRIGRWLTTDPKHAGVSPYWGMNNNPIRVIDPDGGEGKDWILGKDGKYVWDENVTSANDIDLPSGFEYIGANLSDVKSHFTENNSWLSRTFGSKNGGYLSFTNINSYYDAKVPLAVEDMFNKHKWYYNLKEKGDNRADGGYSAIVQNKSLKRILEGHIQTVTGSISLDGVEYNYTAQLGAANNTNLSLIGFFDEHPMKDWTLSTMHGGSLEGKYFYLSNSQIGVNFPVLSVHFKNHEAASSWFLKYSTNY